MLSAPFLSHFILFSRRFSVFGYTNRLQNMLMLSSNRGSNIYSILEIASHNSANQWPRRKCCYNRVEPADGIRSRRPISRPCQSKDSRKYAAPSGVGIGSTCRRIRR
uniref:(northern house mosquito) hypothetical protein n=1 Tax=Culex pipiens TaxID=7175 RepID=A0A8D8AG93_CULPI